MIIKSKLMAALVVAIMFGGILVSTALGWWVSSPGRTPSVISDGSAAGQYNPADIRGSYTFGTISQYFNIPLADLKTAFRVPDGTDPAAFQVKSLESQFAAEAAAGQEIGHTSMRYFVTLYVGLPFDGAEEAWFPPEAAGVLKQKAKLTPEQIKYIDSHTTGGPVPAAQPAPAQPAAPASQNPVEPSPSAERAVKGSTTLQQVIDWGVPKAALEKIFGGKQISDTALTFRDYSTQIGIEFSTVRDAVQAEIDKSAP